MKATCNRVELLEELRAMTRVVDKASTIAAARHLSFGVVDGGIELAGTDTELSLRTSVDATVEVTGRVAPEAHRLYQAVAAMTGDVVELEHFSHGVVVTDLISRYALPGIDPDDLMQVPEVPEGGACLDLTGLQRAATRVLWSVDRSQNSKFIVQAAQLSVGEQVKLVATNGHTLAVATMAESASGFEDDLLSRSLLEQVAGLDGDSVRLVRAEHHIAVVSGRRSLMARRVESNFPDWRRVVGRLKGEAVRFCAAELVAAIRRVAFLSTQRAHYVRLDLEGGACTLTVDSDLGRGTTVVPYQGALDATRCFNPQYLIDAVEAAGGDDVEIEICDNEGDAIVVSPAGNESFQGLVVPVKP